MATGAHTIQPNKASTATKKRVGRGNGSGKGTYSGRGLKGQRARSGGKGGTKRRGFKPHLQKMPKLRGFNSPHAKKETVTLATLDRITSKGDVVTPQFLKKKNVIADPSVGVKIVARGELKTAVTVKDCLASKGAVEQIEKAGGSIQF